MPYFQFFYFVCVPAFMCVEGGACYSVHVKLMGQSQALLFVFLPVGDRAPFCSVCTSPAGCKLPGLVPFLPPSQDRLDYKPALPSLLGKFWRFELRPSNLRGK